MILVDANILMYAAGAQHPNKKPSVGLLESIAEGTVDAALDAEVLQEVLHRYRAIARWAGGTQVHEAARQIFAVVLPITAEVVDHAKELLDQYEGISARDALHAAVVVTHDLEALCSYDMGFDQIPVVRRVSPEELLR